LGNRRHRCAPSESTRRSLAALAGLRCSTPLALLFGRLSMHYRYHDSPIGPLLIAGDENGLQLLLLELDSRPWRIEDSWQPAGRELDAVCSQLDEYFAGKRRQFDLRLAPRGTAFQQAVWQALQAIPYGRTCSYSELAGVIGRPQAVRAVGTANGANPISIIVPCH